MSITPAPEPVQPVHRSFRLTRSTPAVVALQVRPALVLPDREARALLVAAEHADVSRGGRFSAGPAGVQVWSGPWNGAVGSRGSASHFGSVDWSYDTPNRHYITIYRVLVTGKGAAAGYDALGILALVLDLASIPASPEMLEQTARFARDPFRSSIRAALAGASASG